MSVAARHKILKYGGLFRPSRKHRQIFCTGTLPGSTKAAMAALAEGSGRFIKILQTYIFRAMRVDASECRYLWCWELQRRGALHIHAIFEWKSEKIARRFAGKWAEIWADSLDGFAKGLKIDLFERKRGGTWANNRAKWQTNAQFVKKNAAAYLSKYIGKEKKGCEKYYPSRWFGTSRALRQSFGDWLRVNTKERKLSLPAFLGRDAVCSFMREIVAPLLVGESKDISDRASSGGLQFFGYLKDGVRAEAVMELLNENLQVLEKEQMRVDYSTGKRQRRMEYVAMVVEDIEKRSSRPFYFRFIRELPKSTRERVLNRGHLGRNEILDISATMDFVSMIFYPTESSCPSWIQMNRAHMKWLLEECDWLK